MWADFATPLPVGTSGLLSLHSQAGERFSSRPTLMQETAAVGRGRFCGKKVLLVKPMTFMNVSGEAVGKLARFYRVRIGPPLPPLHSCAVCSTPVHRRRQGDAAQSAQPAC